MNPLGITGQAADHHGQALALYPADDLTDRTLIRPDQALCIVTGRRPGRGSYHRNRRRRGTAREHRSALIIYRAEQLADRVPRQTQTVPEVRVLRGALALLSERGRG
ncbi:hypothetical protein E4198_18695 [Streptomyces sp. RKND-216]|uniref:hypothetical protein n=1 Tax=Streptomyces sp. RKND-216 TaxID=2562581 RepID=UPI00109D8C8C|nr:hypothetical protein [Streptomyces sp. RKND-216]THA26441.1 hypothetical protein E4198_18695 [Streptomyces sp. RKND-216]